MGDIPSNVQSLEVFQVSDDRIQKVINSSPKWSREQFKKNIKACDVVIAYKRERYQSGFVAGLFNAISKKLQKSSFSSCKMVGRGANNIIGYGVDNDATTAISALNIDKFFYQHEAALIMRYKGITDEKREKILERFYSHAIKQPSYDGVGLATRSIFAHLFGTISKKDDDKDFSTADQKKLICSSIVFLAYKEAGCNIQHEKEVGDRWIWPYEYIISPSFTCVGGYWSKASGFKQLPGVGTGFKDPEKDQQPEEPGDEKEKTETALAASMALDDAAMLLEKSMRVMARICDIDDTLGNISTSRDAVILHGTKAIEQLEIDGSLSQLCKCDRDKLNTTLVVNTFNTVEATEKEAMKACIVEMQGYIPALTELADATKDSVGYLSVAHKRAKMLIEDFNKINK